METLRAIWIDDNEKIIDIVEQTSSLPVDQFFTRWNSLLSPVHKNATVCIIEKGPQRIIGTKTLNGKEINIVGYNGNYDAVYVLV